jgi:hypothetical protein
VHGDKNNFKMEGTIINKSSKKQTFALVGSLAFVALGIYLLTSTPRTDSVRGLPTHVVGLLSIVFFGTCFVLALKQFLAKGPGLIFSESGFTNLTVFGSGQFIGWDEITGIKVVALQRQKFICVLLKDPQSFIGKAGALTRGIMKANHRFYGSPVQLSASTLACSPEELYQEIRGRWESFRARSSSLHQQQL